MTTADQDDDDRDDFQEEVSADAGMRTPPPTFEFLAHTLFTQAMLALGKIPNPITKKAHKHRATA